MHLEPTAAARVERLDARHVRANGRVEEPDLRLGAPLGDEAVGEEPVEVVGQGAVDRRHAEPAERPLALQGPGLAALVHEHKHRDSGGFDEPHTVDAAHQEEGCVAQDDGALVVLELSRGGSQSSRARPWVSVGCRRRRLTHMTSLPS